MFAEPQRSSTPEQVWPAPPPPSHVTRAPAREPLPSFITPAIDPRLRTAGFAMLASAAVLLLATLTKSWFVAGSEGGVGLLGLEVCRRSGCQSASWFDVPLVPSQIPIFATTALLACLATVGLLVHAGVVLLQGAPGKVRLRWLGHVFGIALVGMVAFVASLSFGHWTRGLSLGWSTVAGIAGLFAAGISAAFVVRPLTRDPHL